MDVDRKSNWKTGVELTLASMATLAIYQVSKGSLLAISLLSASGFEWSMRGQQSLAKRRVMAVCVTPLALCIARCFSIGMYRISGTAGLIPYNGVRWYLASGFAAYKALGFAAELGQERLYAVRCYRHLSGESLFRTRELGRRMDAVVRPDPQNPRLDLNMREHFQPDQWRQAVEDYFLYNLFRNNEEILALFFEASEEQVPMSVWLKHLNERQLQAAVKMAMPPERIDQEEAGPKVFATRDRWRRLINSEAFSDKLGDSTKYGELINQAPAWEAYFATKKAAGADNYADREVVAKHEQSGFQFLYGEFSMEQLPPKRLGEALGLKDPEDFGQMTDKLEVMELDTASRMKELIGGPPLDLDDALAKIKEKAALVDNPSIEEVEEVKVSALITYQRPGQAADYLAPSELHKKIEQAVGYALGAAAVAMIGSTVARMALQQPRWTVIGAVAALAYAHHARARVIAASALDILDREHRAQGRQDQLRAFGSARVELFFKYPLQFDVVRGALQNSNWQYSHYFETALLVYCSLQSLGRIGAGIATFLVVAPLAEGAFRSQLKDQGAIGP